MLVTDKIHVVKNPMSDIFSATYIIVGQEIAIIDSGPPGSPEERIFPYLKSIGYDPTDISIVVNTHWHGDHQGGNWEIKNVSNAKIAIHRLGVCGIENHQQKFADSYGRFARPNEIEQYCKAYVFEQKCPRVDLTLKDGDIIELAGTRVEVTHTPGHTQDSICLYDRKNKTLFSGDSIQCRGPIIDGGTPFYVNLDAYLQSVERLEQLDVDLLLAGHPYQPYKDSVIRGVQIREFLEESKAVAHRIDERIASIVKNSVNPHSLGELANIICSEFGSGSATWIQKALVATHLRKLQKQ